VLAFAVWAAWIGLLVYAGVIAAAYVFGGLVLLGFLPR
jgi:hypothetical protein